MANQISVTVVNVGGNPFSVPLSQSFLTSNILIQAATVDSSPTAQSMITYYSSPFVTQIYYVEESVSELVTAANTDGTSQVALTCYSINGYPQGIPIDISVPAIGISTQTVSDSPIITIVRFMKNSFGVSESEAAIVAAANAGGGGGGDVSSVFGRTGAVTAEAGDYIFSQIGSTPTTLSGYGITDGVSTGGSYSNPSWITGLAWSKISSTPTTLSGYGITDAIVAAGKSGGQTLIGGTGVGDALTLQGTSANGTATTAAIVANVGNNGATKALEILNNGAVGIGTGSTATSSYGLTVRQPNDGAADISVKFMANNGTTYSSLGYAGLTFNGGGTIKTNSGSITITPNGGNTTFSVGAIITAASTTSAPAIRLTQGVAPSSPTDGDMWREDNTNTGWKIRINGVTKTVTVA